MANFHIGDVVKVDGTRIKAPITHIQSSIDGDAARYKVEGRYWNEPSISLVKAAPAKDAKALDSSKRARMHRALDAVMDSVKGKARDAESGPYDVGYMPKSGDPKGTWRDVVITASSWNDAMSKAKAGVRSGEELYRVSPRDKSAPWAK